MVCLLPSSVGINYIEDACNNKYCFSFQEAFKAVEDIHGLFALSKKPPKPQLMANYYNKVSTVFWKSGNALFHACTLHRLYHLSREMRKNLTQEEMQRYLIHYLYRSAHDLFCQRPDG